MSDFSSMHNFQLPIYKELVAGLVPLIGFSAALVLLIGFWADFQDPYRLLSLHPTH